jgi:hypothetical protein
MERQWAAQAAQLIRIFLAGFTVESVKYRRDVRHRHPLSRGSDDSRFFNLTKIDLLTYTVVSRRSQMVRTNKLRFSQPSQHAQLPISHRLG